jgi:hypothetical protein
LVAVVQEAYVQGISTRSVDDLLQPMGMSGLSKSQVSRLCTEIDERVQSFLNRPIEGDWPYLWIDATYLKVRKAGRIVSAAAIIAIGAGQVHTAHLQQTRAQVELRRVAGLVALLARIGLNSGDMQGVQLGLDLVIALLQLAAA